MKNILRTVKGILALSLVVVLSACGSKNELKDDVIKVSVTLDPHSKIVEAARPQLEAAGYELEIIVLDDYYIFNEALDNNEVDANYFQHEPFFNEQIETNGYDITNVAGIHIEPLGFYSQNINDVDELKDGAEIIISNSIADQGRSLAILDEAGVIELDKDVDAVSATFDDIVSNPKNVTFREVKPELLVTTYEEKEGDLVAINGNYAIQVGLNPSKDAVILESADQDNPYVNIVAVKAGNEDSEKTKVLVKALQSEEVKQYILDTYSDGSVIPAN